MVEGTNITESVLTQCYGHAVEFAEANVRFAERLSNTPGLSDGVKTPWYHQLRRLRAVLTMPRVLLADETGLGKTAVVVLAKLFAELDPAYRAHLLEGTNDSPGVTRVPHGQRKVAIVLSTTSGMRDPWNDGEINAYVPRAFPHQRVLQLRKTRDVQVLDSESVDFLVVNYEKLLIPKVVRALVRLIASETVSLVALDESHQLRNPKAQRFIPEDTRELRSGFLAILGAMRKANALPRLLLLSATPIANLPTDLGVLVHLLDPTQGIQEVRSTRSLRLLRDLFWQGSTFRLDKSMAKDLLGLPDITEAEERIAISTAQADAYATAWESVVAGGGKIRSLAHALFAAKLGYLERQVPQWRAEGKHVVIFTAFKTGVTRELAERLGGAWIDGDVPVDVRNARARAFRSGETPILIATTRTSAESISLVTGDRPCVVVRFEPFFTPYEWVQSVGRVWRPGQYGAVSVITLVAGGPELAQRLTGACARVEQRYLLRRQRTWRPTSFDEDQLTINTQKRHAADQLYAGHDVTKLTTRLLTATTENALRTEMTSLKFSSANHRACFTARCWIGRGLTYIQQVASSSSGQQYAVDYNDGWEFTASAHTGELIRQIVGAYERGTGVTLGRIVDQGAGPGCMARALRRSMTAIDVAPGMLKLAREEIRKLNRRERLRVKLRTLRKPIQTCGLADAQTDLAIAAYALQYARQTRNPTHATEREIEQIVLETNRILATGGLWIVALPYNIARVMIERFEHVVAQYGFDILPVSGFYEPSLAQDVDGNTRKPASAFRGVWLTVARKRDPVNAFVELAPQGLSFQPIALAGGTTRRGLRQTWKRKLVTAERIIAFRHKNSRSLEDLISETIGRVTAA